ncbi:MAG: hypothetical protein GXO26_04430 [Crenarchaeota archaeon]|nr:hypothetical protein [Thermoproteota archaeon]
MSIQRSKNSSEKYFEIVGDLNAIKGKPVVVFDLDGVLIDSSRRYRKCLEELGVTDKYQLYTDRELRRKFWKLFLSPKYMYLDTPVKPVVSIVREKAESYAVVIVTGRTPNMIRETINQLKSFGIPFTAIIFRGRENFDKDYKYKRNVLELIRCKTIVEEIHDDSSEVCSSLLDVPRLGTFFWYKPGKYVFVPSHSIWVNGLRTSIPPNNDVIRELVNKIDKPAVIEWLGYTIHARDGFDALSVVWYIAFLLDKLELSDVIHRGEASFTSLEMLEYIKDEGETEKKTRITLHGRKYIIIGKTERPVNLDKLFSDKERLLRKAYTLMIKEVAELLSYIVYPVQGALVLDAPDLFRDMLKTTAYIRLHSRKPADKIIIPKTITTKEIRRNKELLRTLKVYSAYNLKEDITIPIKDLTGYSLVAKNGMILAVTMIKAPKLSTAGSSDNVVEELKLFHEHVMEYVNLATEAKKIVKQVLQKHGIKPRRVYAIPYKEYIAINAKL